MVRLLLGSLLLVVVVAPARAQGDDAETFFELKIRPVLAETCFKCHGGKKVSHGLRVDSRQALLQGGDSGPAVVPGDAARSLLVRALRHADDTVKMPPDRKLPDAVVADFVTWIERGAAWPRPTAGSPAFQSQQ